MCKWAVYGCASDMTLKVVNPGALYGGMGGGGHSARVPTRTVYKYLDKAKFDKDLIWFNFEIFKFANREGNPIKVLSFKYYH